MTALKKETLPPPPITVDEFIDWPGDGIHKKFQLVDGVIRAMPPASTTHGALQAKLASVIDQLLVAANSPCNVFTEPAVATRIRADVNSRVPDLAVSCAATEAGQIYLPDPILQIKIMSPGNTSDTWDNVWAYASIPSVTEILIVQSTRIEAQLLRRGPDAAWPKEPEQIGRGDRLKLASIALDCAIEDVYAKTHLAAS